MPLANLPRDLRHVSQYVCHMDTIWYIMKRTTKNCRHQDSRQFSYALTVDLLPFGFGVVKLFV